MGIQITLDAVLERKGMRGKELAARIGVSETHLSLFRSGVSLGSCCGGSRDLMEPRGFSPGTSLSHPCW